MSLPSSLRYKARKREKARELARKAEKEITNPVGPVVENPTGSRVVDPAGDYLANSKGAIVENPMGPYVENPSQDLGKHLPPMEQEDYNNLMKNMGEAVNSTAVQSKEYSMPMSFSESKDYITLEETPSREPESFVANNGMED